MGALAKTGFLLEQLAIISSRFWQGPEAVPAGVVGMGMLARLVRVELRMGLVVGMLEVDMAEVEMSDVEVSEVVLPLPIALMQANRSG